MKNINNNGSSKFQVLVALLVMTAIAGGAGYFIHYLSKRFSSEGAELQKQTAASKAEEVYERVASLAESSDIDFDFDHATASCIGVSQRGFTIITISTNNLYIKDESFAGTDCETDDEKVEYARTFLGDRSGELLFEGIKYFGISTSAKTDGTSLVTIKAIAGDESHLLEKEIILNEYTVKRANGIEFVREKEPVVLPEEQTPAAIDTNPGQSVENIEIVDSGNEVKEPQETVVPETNKADLEQESEIVNQEVQKNDEPKAPVFDETTDRLAIDVLKSSSADSEIEVKILCTESRAKEGWCVGGIGIGRVEISENECFQYKLSADPTVGKIYVVRFAVCDILAELRSTGSVEAYMSFYNGFEILEVNVVAPLE